MDLHNRVISRYSTVAWKLEKVTGEHTVDDTVYCANLPWLFSKGKEHKAFSGRQTKAKGKEAPEGTSQGTSSVEDLMVSLQTELSSLPSPKRQRFLDSVVREVVSLKQMEEAHQDLYLSDLRAMKPKAFFIPCKGVHTTMY